MIDTILRQFAARYWRRRIVKYEAQREKWTEHFKDWKSENPDRCYYCAYTRWANDVQGVKIVLEAHTCVEGKSPPQSLPRAEVVS